MRSSFGKQKRWIRHRLGDTVNWAGKHRPVTHVLAASSLPVKNDDRVASRSSLQVCGPPG